MAALVWSQAIITTAVVLLVAATIRLLSILPPRRQPPARRKRGAPAHLLIVLGSGGHTAEMLSMLRKAINSPPNNQTSRTSERAVVDTNIKLDWSQFTFRTYVISSGDDFSATRAVEFERETAQLTSKPAMAKSRLISPPSYMIRPVPRARKIHQSLLTTPISSLNCLLTCIQYLYYHPSGYPDLILTNGPATATILIFASVMLRFFDVKGAHSRGKMRTIYVESWARVKNLSLSGKILCWVADRVLVQWEQLEGVRGRGEFLGVLV